MIQLTLQHLQGLIPLDHLPLSHQQVLIESCVRKFVSVGRIVLEPGRQAEGLLFLLSGKVKLTNAQKIITPAHRFSLQSAVLRNETVVAETDCSFLQVDAAQLDKLLAWAESARYIENDIVAQSTLETDVDWMITILVSNLFYKVPPLNFEKLYDRLIPMPVKQGDVVLEQGDVGDGCYFIKNGTAEVLRKESEHATPVKLADIGYGRCFGEDALVQETVRNATVRMTTDGMLMKMEKRDFVQLLKEPPVQSLMAADLDMALLTGAELLDVRTLDEYNAIHLKNGIHAPLGLLRIKSRLLDKNRDYVIYCDSGRRALAATYLLEQQGFRVSMLAGGLNKLPESLRQSLCVAG